MADPYIVLWTLVLICMVVLEASTLSLVSIWFAIGSIVPIVIASKGYGIGVQILGFLIASGILLVTIMPIAKKHFSQKSQPTNADRIIGEEGVAISNINETEGTGQIKVMGNIWSAKSINGKDIKLGTRVIIKKIEGVKAIVEEKGDTQ